MMRCDNCHLEFEAGGSCPRCSSKRVRYYRDPKKEAEKLAKQQAAMIAAGILPAGSVLDPNAAPGTPGAPVELNPDGTPKVAPTGPVVYSSQGTRIEGDTKAAWMSFHTQTSNACRECGSSTWDLDYKHKQRVCRKCGSITSLPRGR